MKILNYLFVTAIALFACCACSDDNNMPEPPAEPEGADYLFMFYGMGGDKIDESLISNLFMALDAGNDDKVKMTFQMKMSSKFQEKYPSFKGTHRLTGEDNTYLKGNFKSMSEIYPRIMETKMDEFLGQLKTVKMGGADYDMTCADSLTAFINWSKAKYPTAKRTILVLAGHGHGWCLNDDGVKDNATTRSILIDDNTTSFMSLNDVVKGIKNAGNVDLLYADACMMSMYETLYGYAECAKYCLASFELTPSAGGDYTKFINHLKEAGSTEEGLVKAMHKHCDYCVSGEWWAADNFADLGLYDLSKIGNLSKVMKEVVDVLVADDTNSKYISNAFLNCEIVDAKPPITKNEFPDDYIELMKKDQIDFSTQSILHWIGSNFDLLESKGLKGDLDTYFSLNNAIFEYSFSFTDLLRNIDNALTAAGVTDNPYTALRQKFLAALKEMAYIKCTTPKSVTGIDPAYELCSPGIMIMPMATQKIYEDFYNSKNYLAVNYVEEALKIYQSTAFDKQVEWSRMLQKLDVLPTFLTNPIRKEVK